MTFTTDARRRGGGVGREGGGGEDVWLGEDLVCREEGRGGKGATDRYPRGEYTIDLFVGGC